MAKGGDVPKIISRALESAASSVEDLAEEVGVSAATLWAWASGRRNPSPENRARLVEALRKRGGELQELAEALEE